MNQKIVKNILIVVVVILVGLAGYLIWNLIISPLNSNIQQIVFTSKEECELKTGKLCDFQMCDYIPEGKTYEETCGKDFKKGWVPNNSVSISSEVKNFEECVNKGYIVSESYPRQCRTPEDKRFIEEITENPLPENRPITISGEITCLTKTGKGSQTMECAIGLKGDDGRYYGLKNLFNLDPEYKFSNTGLRVEVSGMFNKKEANNNYDMTGVIDVTSIKEVAENLKNQKF